jgi:ribosomal protein L40E
MTDGEIALESSLTDVIMDLIAGAGGSPSPSLVFREPKQKPWLILADGKPSFLCKACGLVMIIQNEDDTQTECVVCRTKMPPRVTSCEKCGWSYLQNEADK